MDTVAAPLLRHRFRAMGTEIELLVEADEAARRSRGRRGRVPPARGAPFPLPRRLGALPTQLGRRARRRPDLLRVVELALAAKDRTGGRFDITVHNALVAAGYDRSFELVPTVDATPVPSPVRQAAGVRVRDGVIRLDRGVRLDLGGIGKGYACERAAEILATAGPCLVGAGGRHRHPRRRLDRLGRDGGRTAHARALRQ